MAKKMKKKTAVKKTKTKAKANKAKVRRAAPRKAPVFKSISRHAAEARSSSRSAEEKPLSASEIQKFRDLLSEKQEEMSDVVHRKKDEQEFQQEEPEIGDEADIATRSVEKELLFDITDSEKQNLDRIEAALRKIEKGVYGRCESCQKTIPRLRLEVMPWARYCIHCQAQNEVPPGVE